MPKRSLAAIGLLATVTALLFAWSFAQRDADQGLLAYANAHLETDCILITIGEYHYEQATTLSLTEPADIEPLLQALDLAAWQRSDKGQPQTPPYYRIDLGSGLLLTLYKDIPQGRLLLFDQYASSGEQRILQRSADYNIPASFWQGIRLLDIDS